MEGGFLMDGRAYGDELARKWSPEAVEAAVEGPAGVSAGPGEGEGSERLTEADLQALLGGPYAGDDDWDMWAARRGDGA